MSVCCGHTQQNDLFKETVIKFLSVYFKLYPGQRINIEGGIPSPQQMPVMEAETPPLLAMTILETMMMVFALSEIGSRLRDNIFNRVRRRVAVSKR